MTVPIAARRSATLRAASSGTLSATAAISDHRVGSVGAIMPALAASCWIMSPALPEMSCVLVTVTPPIWVCLSLRFGLRIPLPDVVSMQTRQPNLEGNGAIPLRPGSTARTRKKRRSD